MRIYSVEHPDGLASMISTSKSTKSKSNAMRRILGPKLCLLLAISAILSYSLRQQWKAIKTNPNAVETETRDMNSRDQQMLEAEEDAFEVEPVSDENNDGVEVGDNENGNYVDSATGSTSTVDVRSDTSYTFDESKQRDGNHDNDNKMDSMTESTNTIDISRYMFEEINKNNDNDNEEDEIKNNGVMGFDANMNSYIDDEPMSAGDFDGKSSNWNNDVLPNKNNEELKTSGNMDNSDVKWTFRDATLSLINKKDGDEDSAGYSSRLTAQFGVMQFSETNDADEENEANEENVKDEESFENSDLELSFAENGAYQSFSNKMNELRPTELQDESVTDVTVTVSDSQAQTVLTEEQPTEEHFQSYNEDVGKTSHMQDNTFKDESRAVVEYGSEITGQESENDNFDQLMGNNENQPFLNSAGDVADRNVHGINVLDDPLHGQWEEPGGHDSHESVDLIVNQSVNSSSEYNDDIMNSVSEIIKNDTVSLSDIISTERSLERNSNNRDDMRDVTNSDTYLDLKDNGTDPLSDTNSNTYSRTSFVGVHDSRDLDSSNNDAVFLEKLQKDVNVQFDTMIQNELTTEDEPGPYNKESVMQHHPEFSDEEQNKMVQNNFNRNIGSASSQQSNTILNHDLNNFVGNQNNDVSFGGSNSEQDVQSSVDNKGYPVLESPSFDDFRGFNIKYVNTNNQNQMVHEMNNNKYPYFDTPQMLPEILGNKISQPDIVSEITDVKDVEHGDMTLLSNDPINRLKFGNGDSTVPNLREQENNQLLATHEQAGASNSQRAMENEPNIYQREHEAQAALTFTGEDTLSYISNQDAHEKVTNYEQLANSGNSISKPPGYLRRTLLGIISDLWGGYSDDNEGAGDGEVERSPYPYRLFLGDDDVNDEKDIGLNRDADTGGYEGGNYDSIYDSDSNFVIDHFDYQENGGGQNAYGNREYGYENNNNIDNTNIDNGIDMFKNDNSFYKDQTDMINNINNNLNDNDNFNSNNNNIVNNNDDGNINNIIDDYNYYDNNKINNGYNDNKNSNPYNYINSDGIAGIREKYLAVETGVRRQTTTPNNNGGSYDNPRPLTEDEYNALRTQPYRQDPLTTDALLSINNQNSIHENSNIYIETQREDTSETWNQNSIYDILQPTQNHFQDRDYYTEEKEQLFENPTHELESIESQKHEENGIIKTLLRGREDSMGQGYDYMDGLKYGLDSFQRDNEENGNLHQPRDEKLGQEREKTLKSDAYSFNDLLTNHGEADVVSETSTTDLTSSSEDLRVVNEPGLSHCPVNLELSPVPHPVTALVIFPGALADWLNNAIEQLSGEPSDSLYSVMAGLKNGDTSAFFQMPKRCVIHTHSAQSTEFDRAIIIINNPVAVERKHLRFLPFAFEWRRYYLWDNTMTSWLSSDIPLLVVTADDLIADPETHLRKIAFFLDIDKERVDRSMTCALLQKPPILIDDVTKMAGVYSSDRQRLSRSIDEVIEVASKKAPDILHRLFQYKTILYI